MIAINVLGQHREPPCTSSEQNNNGTVNAATAVTPSHSSNNTNNNALLLVNNPKYTSPYDDLAFEMYVDQEVARIIRTMEAKKQEAVICKSVTYLQD